MSDFEMLLSAWLNGGEIPADFKPSSNVEEYLLAILNGVDDDVDPKSRADVLLDAIATKYAGYADGIDDLRDTLGFTGHPVYDDATTPELIAAAQKVVNIVALVDLQTRGVLGVENNTVALFDAYENLPSGGASLNIAYGDTAPEDTTKLWVKTAQPQNVTVDYNPDNTVETVDALSATLTSPCGWLRCGSVGEKIYLFGTDASGVIRVFDTETNTLSSTGQVHGLVGSSCGVVDTNIYLFGGELEYGAQSTIKKYDTVNNSISTVASLPQAMYTSACGVVGKKCYIFGGYNGSVYFDTIYVFDTETDALTTLPVTLPTASAKIGVGVVGTKIYLFGGRTSDPNPLNTINVFDTATNTISALPVTFQTPYAEMGVATFGTKCYLLGGLVPSNGSRVSVDTITVFDAETETLTTLVETLPQPLYGAGVGSVGNDAYIFGGTSSQLGYIPLDTIYKFNITFPLAEGAVFVNVDMLRNKFDLLTAPTKVTVGVAAVSKGNASGYAENCEAYLHDGTQWRQI
jgi:hypothetical protein